MSDKELIETVLIEVEGKNKTKDIQIFTLSTCMWCKKCKKYLKDKDVQYKYVDVDKIQPSQKAKILAYLKENYSQRISYPFLVCDDKYILGYDQKKYEELMDTGEN